MKSLFLSLLVLISLILCGILFLPLERLGFGMAEAAQKAEIADDKKQVSAELLVEGLDNPWGMAMLPNQDILVTEKKGSLRIVRNGTLLQKEVPGLPDIAVLGQGGLLDIALHPRFSENSFIYISYASAQAEGEGANTAVLRARYAESGLSELKVIYQAQPASTAGQHFGSRLAFSPKGKLFFSIGDRGARDRYPQNINLDGGKIYRINDDGSIPEDNPFPNSERPAIFSFGHRNPQGLAFHPERAELWSHEHGPRGGDELNIIRAGRNYGWPLISYGINYSGTKFTEHTHREGMEQPVSYWVPSIAPCGMTFVRSKRYPDWTGDILLGSLKFGYLVRVDLENGKVRAQEKVLDGIGRVRNVIEGSDGWLYVAIEGKGIYKILPNVSS